MRSSMPSSIAPALLAQLQKDAAGFRGTFACEPSSRDNYAEGEMSLTYTGEDEDVPVEIANEIQGEHIAAPLARMLNAVPALLEAARERDELRERIVKVRKAGIDALRCAAEQSPNGDESIRQLAAQLEMPPCRECNDNVWCGACNGHGFTKEEAE